MRVTDMGNTGIVRTYLEQKWHDLYRMAYAWSHDPQLASDIAQETVTRALKKAGQLREPQAIGVWVYRILQSCWIDRYKADRRFEPLPEVEIQSKESSALEDLEQQDLVSRVRRALAGLPFEQRQIIALIDLEGFSYSQVADILQVPMGTIMSRLCRARRQLKQRLHEQAALVQHHTNVRRIK